MFCPNCRAHYREGIATCADCGSPLVATLPDLPSREPQQYSVVGSYHDLGSAQVAVGALTDSGIQCWLRDEQTVGVDWLLSPAIGGARLQVRAEDLEDARSILEAAAPLTEPELQPLDPNEEAEFAQGSRWSKRIVGVVAMILMAPIGLIVAIPMLLLGRKRRRDVDPK